MIHYCIQSYNTKPRRTSTPWRWSWRWSSVASFIVALQTSSWSSPTNLSQRVFVWNSKRRSFSLHYPPRVAGLSASIFYYWHCPVDLTIICMHITISMYACMQAGRLGLHCSIIMYDNIESVYFCESIFYDLLNGWIQWTFMVCLIWSKTIEL